ncbi:17540_t:CDS:1, partial [Acaulospora colombiana]
KSANPGSSLISTKNRLGKAKNTEFDTLREALTSHQDISALFIGIWDAIKHLLECVTVRKFRMSSFRQMKTNHKGVICERNVRNSVLIAREMSYRKVTVPLRISIFSSRLESVASVLLTRNGEVLSAYSPPFISKAIIVRKVYSPLVSCPRRGRSDITNDLHKDALVDVCKASSKRYTPFESKEVIVPVKIITLIDTFYCDLSTYHPLMPRCRQNVLHPKDHQRLQSDKTTNFAFLWIGG